MRWPLARQILLPMVGILLLTVGLASALAAWLASRQVKQRIEGQLADIAQTLSASNFPLESSVLRQARGLTGMELVLVDSSSQAVAASDDRLAAFIDEAPAVEGWIDTTRAVTVRGNSRNATEGVPYSANGNSRNATEGVPYSANSDSRNATEGVPYSARTFFHSIITVDRRAVGGTQQTLHVFYPQDAWQAARWQATWPPLATGGAAMLLVAVAAYAVAHRVTQPIRQLQAHVARIADGQFTSLATSARDDEVRDLALAVNQMAAKLADYETKAREQERLSTLGTLGGGIAHQIRNAATGCRIALDLHERDGEARRPELHSGRDGLQIRPTEPSTPLAVAKRQLDLIETHIQRFLTLGRPAPERRDEVELAAVMEEALSLVEPMAQHLCSPLEFEPPAEPLVVLGDQQSLAQMIVNLLMNAIQAAAHLHALAGGSSGTDFQSVRDGMQFRPTSRGAVIVRIERAGTNRARIAVGDPGPGPSPAIRDRLFEPFATDKPGGTGLGLVVARQIAEDHGGTIRWTRREECTWFIVELPLHGNGAS